MSNRLSEILANKRLEIDSLNLAQERAAARAAPPPREFAASLKKPAGAPMRLIAELKRASPSRGLLAPGLDLLQVARVYAQNGAVAVSVLTDEKYFLGSLQILDVLRQEPQVALPLLRKDFILAPVQVYQSRACGADAILLIAAALPDDGELSELHALVRELGLAALVEVHSAVEIERVLKIPGLELMGINNRDLATFQVTLETTERLRPLVPPGVTLVAESGIFTAADVARLGTLGVDAVLVGEALVTAPDIGARVRELSGVRVEP